MRGICPRIIGEIMNDNLEEITFTQNYKVNAIDGPQYQKGESIKVKPDSAIHFLSRGVAVRGKSETEPAEEKTGSADDGADENQGGDGNGSGSADDDQNQKDDVDTTTNKKSSKKKSTKKAE